MIEDAVRRDLGLDVLERIWADQELDEGDAMSRAWRAGHFEVLVSPTTATCSTSPAGSLSSRLVSGSSAPDGRT